MKEKFKFKAKYLNKILWILVVIGITISLIIFLGMEIDLSYRYFLSVVVVFFGLLIVFYLNRNELAELNIEEEKLELDFFNKVFFKRGSLNCLKQEFIIKLNDDVIDLYKGNKIMGKIRKTSTDAGSWEKLKNYFNQSP